MMDSIVSFRSEEQDRPRPNFFFLYSNIYEYEMGLQRFSVSLNSQVAISPDLLTCYTGGGL